jgi:hypothetical protein
MGKRVSLTPLAVARLCGKKQDRNEVKKERKQKKNGRISAIYSSSIEEFLVNSSNSSDNTKIKARTRIDPLVWHKVAVIFGTANFI